MSKDNKQTALLYLQSHHLRKLKEQGVIWEFSFLQLEGVLEELFTLQGKSERIKNFPYPRHFATLNHFFMWIFVLLLPLALVPQFAEIGKEFAENHPLVSDLFVWFCIPFYASSLSHGFSIRWNGLGGQGKILLRERRMMFRFPPLPEELKLIYDKIWAKTKEEIPEQFP
ncbi:MAG: bestrophin family ion channel [Saprospiraceae bacterium]